MKKYVINTVLFLVIIVVTVTIRAQSPVNSMIAEAEEFFKSGRYASALEELKFALEWSSVDYEELEQIYLLMAFCHFRQNKLYLAESELEEALEINPSITLDVEKYEPDLIEFVENLKAEIIGEVSFTSSPSGALVYVNGRYKGTTPLELRHISSEIRVYFIREGYDAESRSVTVFPQERTIVEVELKFSDFANTIIVETEPKLVEVYADNQFKGDSPLIITGMIPGRYRLTFKKRGYYTREDLLIVEPRKLQRLNIELIKIRDRFILSELLPGLGQFVQGYPLHGAIISSLWAGYWLFYRRMITHHEYKYQSGSFLGDYNVQRVLSNGKILTVSEWQRAKSKEEWDYEKKRRNVILLGLMIYGVNLADMSWILWYEEGKRMYEELKKFGFDFNCRDDRIGLSLTYRF